MARTAKTNIKIQNGGLLLGSSFDTLNFNTGISGIDSGSGVVEVDATGSGGAFAGSQEKSTTTPNGVVTTFTFAHPPKIIFWNGAMQTITDDYTVSGSTITFTASAGIPVTGDKITNMYA